MHNSVLPTVRFTDMSQQEEANNLVLELGPKAITQFKKYHPLKITISYTNPYQTAAILKTFIDVRHPDELAEITIGCFS